MLNNWREKGFAQPPQKVVAKGDEIIYRVGGGPKSLVLGKFFTPLKVTSVSQAELHLNIVLWGNQSRYRATYRVKPRTEMWIGQVAHGLFDIGVRNSIQIYIDNPISKVELISDIEPLKQDLFVIPRTGHA